MHVCVYGGLSANNQSQTVGPMVPIGSTCSTWLLARCEDMELKQLHLCHATGFGSSLKLLIGTKKGQPAPSRW